MGYLMSYSNSAIIHAQLEAISSLELRDAAASVIAKRDNALSALWSLGEERKFKFETLQAHQVAGLAYELQSVALYSFREKLLEHGLAALDQAAYLRAFIELPEILGGLHDKTPLRDGFMAFSWDNEREGDEFWRELQGLIVAESTEKVDMLGRHTISLAPRIWSGLSEAQKYVAAGVTFLTGLNEFHRTGSFMEAAGLVRTRYTHDLLSAVITPNKELTQGMAFAENRWMPFTLSDERKEVKYDVLAELLEDGFRFTTRPHIETLTH